MTHTPSIPVVLTEEMVEEIERFGRLRQPNEAVGLLLPEPWHGRSVIELANRSLTPNNEFELNTSDMQLALADWVEETQGRWVWSVTLWHTHPQGNVGPSRFDLRNRLNGIAHLVVALTDTEAIPTWY